MCSGCKQTHTWYLTALYTPIISRCLNVLTELVRKLKEKWKWKLLLWKFTLISFNKHDISWQTCIQTKKCEFNKKEKNEDGYTSLYAVTANNVLKTVKIWVFIFILQITYLLVNI